MVNPSDAVVPGYLYEYWFDVTSIGTLLLSFDATPSVDAGTETVTVLLPVDVGVKGANVTGVGTLQPGMLATTRVSVKDSAPAILKVTGTSLSGQSPALRTTVCRA